MDRLSKEKRSLLMSKVKTTGTDIEKSLLLIVRPFWTVERYRKNARSLPGKPDVVFPKSKIAIFADGDFWHGRDFARWGKSVPDFWKQKIARNIARDKEQSQLLRKRGYKVLRFWGTSIKKSPKVVQAKIVRALGL